jgi:hypothetical protein
VRGKELRRFAVALTFFFISLGGICLGAVPGGSLVDAASDECDTINPIWKPGLRGMPEYLTIQNGALSIRSIDNGDDPYPSAEDMITTYSDQIGRPLDASDEPSVVASVWFPPFSEWPTGVNATDFREWLGFRVGAVDAGLPENGGLYFPGIFVSTDDAGPCLIARVGDGYHADVTIRRVSVSGWWTLGLSWNAEGRTEYYAAPGQVTLTAQNLLYTEPTMSDPIANRSMDQLLGNFWALRMTYPSTGQLSPNWLIDFTRVYVGNPAPMPRLVAAVVNRKAHVEIDGSAQGFRYLFQRSIDLVHWTTIMDAVSDGNDLVYEETLSASQFFRVARP